MRTNRRVIIAGGGISGLVAARELRARGWMVTLFEPRARLGGRILTVTSPAHGFAVDLGPEFIHGSAPETMALIPAPRPVITHEPDRSRVYWQGQLKVADDFQTDLETFMQAVDRAGPDVSGTDVFVHLKDKLSPLRQAALENYIEGFNAADLNSLSARAYVDETERAGDDMASSSHLLSGYASLVERLAKALSEGDHAAQIELNSRVSKVNWRRGAVEVKIESSEGRPSRLFHADAFLSTLPVNFYTFTADDPGHVAFAPEITSKRKAARQIILGHVHKQVLIFKYPLWEKPERGNIEFISSPELTFGARWTWGWLKPFTLTSWCGGRKAFRLVGKSEAEILDLSLRDLSMVTGLPIGEVERAVAEVHFHDWVADPWSRGAYSYVAVGGADARAHLAEPIEGTLFFAGEALMSDGSAATVHGAIRSAIAAAKQFPIT